MTELLIIKTTDAGKIKTLLDKGKADYQIIYDELIASKSKDKLRKYIEMKSKENIFADYGEAIKDKEREKELALWEQADEEDEEELGRKYVK